MDFLTEPSGYDDIEDISVNSGWLFFAVSKSNKSISGIWSHYWYLGHFKKDFLLFQNWLY